MVREGESPPRAGAILSDQNGVSSTTDHVVPERNNAEAASFVVRIWLPSRADESEYRGWVEHVQTGRRTAFLGLDQLPSVIAEAVGIRRLRGRSWDERFRRWRVSLAEWFWHRQKGEV